MRSRFQVGNPPTGAAFSILLALTLWVCCAAQRCGEIFPDGNYDVSKATLGLVRGDLQALIDCAPVDAALVLAGDVVVNSTAAIRLAKPIKVTSRAFGNKRPKLSCPDDSTPIFEISSVGVELSNLILSNCDLNSTNSAGVVVNVIAQNVSSASEQQSVVFKSVDFLGIRNANGTGAIHVSSAASVKFDSINFLGNFGLRGGGVTLDSTGLRAEFRDCLFEGNEADKEGGGIHQNASTILTISGCSFRHNSGQSAGAVHVKGEPPQSSLEITQSNFKNNTAAKFIAGVSPEAGAILAKGPTLTIKMKGCIVEQNKSIFPGGAMKIVESRRPGRIDVEIDDTIFRDNVGLDGGAILLQSPRKSMTVTISNSRFLGNTAKFTIDIPEFIEAGKADSRTDPSKGGAIAADGSGIALTSINNTFESNRAQALGGSLQKGALGGAIYATDILQMTFVGTLFSNNTSENLDTLGFHAAGGAMAIQAVGVLLSRVLKAPEDSECASQCSRAESEKFGITNVIEGCGERTGPDSRMCVLGNATKCDGFPIDTFNVDEEGKVAALCTVEKVNATVRIAKTQFIGNQVVHGFGGALSATEKALVVELEADTVEFMDNMVRNGSGGAVNVASGAQLLGKGVLLENNEAEGNGGAISLQGIGTGLRLSKSTLAANMAGESGGAIWVNAMDMAIQLNNDTTLQGNFAKVAGGAIAAFGSNGDMIIANASFKNNAARTLGGALRGESFSERLRIRMSDVTFDGNRISHPEFPGLRAGKGGAVSLEGDAVVLKVTGTANSFKNNAAKEGGAIRLFDVSRVSIKNASFVDNAGLSGGGIHASFTSKTRGQSVKLLDVKFVRNSAFMGGGILADALSASEAFVPGDGLGVTLFAPTEEPATNQLVVERANFTGNSVVKDGGGLLLIDGRAVCAECVFSENVVTADSERGGGGGGAIKLAGAAFFRMDGGRIERNRAGNGGGVLLDDASFEGTGVWVMANTAFQFGGGFFVQATERLGKTLLRLEASIVDANEAHSGGGIYASVQSPVPPPNGGERVGLDPEACKRVIVSEESLLSNLGDSFDVVLDVVGDTCKVQANPTRLAGAAARPAIALNETALARNFAASSGGALFADDPALVCACCEGSCTVTCSSETDVKGIPASSRDPAASLGAVCESLWAGNDVDIEGYGSRIASVETEADIVSPLFSQPLEDDQLFVLDHQSGQPLGELTVILKDSFGQVVTTTGPDLFVRVVADDAALLSGQVDKQVEKGEAKFDSIIATGPPEEYLLTVTFPTSARVRQRHFRVHIRGCKRGEKEREEDRSSDGRVASPFMCELCPNETFSFDATECQACPELAECNGASIVPADGYWHSSTWSPQIHDCLVQVACTYPLRGVTLLANSTSVFDKPLGYDQGYALCNEGYEGVLCGSCKKGYGRIRAFECEKCVSRGTAMAIYLVGLLWIVLFVAFLIKKAMSAGTPIAVQQSPNGAVQEAANGVMQAGQPQICLGANAASENAKILMNFLQVTSIALVVNVKWRREVRDIISFADMISGFSANGGLLSMDCSMDFDAATPVSIQHALLALSIPFCIMALFAAFWFVLHLRRRRRPVADGYYRRCAFVSVLVIVYVFYTGTTKEVLRILHKVTVDDETGDFAVSTATGAFWAGDTSHRYFEGDHALLAGLVGVPVLLIISVGFPAFLAFTLWRHVRRGGQGLGEEENFARKFGFLYRAYKPETVYWEMVIMARKALLVAIVVFAYPLGGNLQGIFALMILVGAMTLHLVAHPFRTQLNQLNHRETVSLCGSAFTYMAGMAFNDDNLPGYGKVILSVLVIFVIIGIVAYLVWGVLVEGLKKLDEVLDKKLIDRPDDVTHLGKVALLMNFYWLAAMTWIWTHIDSMLSTGNASVAEKSNLTQRGGESPQSNI